MWLIDAKTTRLVHVNDVADKPRYAILSHTWGEGEVSFRDMSARSSRISRKPQRRSAWSKIENSCRLALSYKCDYVWIDTCCIDSSSSSELQQAINSMFRWYERAEICFVHLADVSVDKDHNRLKSAFRDSRWFKRGWTLQELLAPSTLVFYDQTWSVIGDKDDADLRGSISEVTGIDEYYLNPANRIVFNSVHQWLSRASVAERLSWAAGRETTRAEDMAYCLLGIFDINMPMLYGEGIKAFRRLQEEIMKVDDDCSLLCWGYDMAQEALTLFEDESSILAPHPKYFKNCRGIKPCTLPGYMMPSFSLNQRGLKIKAPIRDDVTHAHLSYVVLGCGLVPETDGGNEQDKAGSRSFVSLPLVSNGACRSRTGDVETQQGEYHRPTWCRPTLVSMKFLKKAKLKELLIRRAASKSTVTIRRCPFRLLFQNSPLFKTEHVVAIYPPQPIPGALASLGRKAMHQTGFWNDSDKRDLLSDSYVRKIHSDNNPSGGDDPDNQLLSDVQVMIHLRFSASEMFLVTVELGDSIGHRIFRCRLYQCAKQLGFEDLHALSISQDYDQLRILGCDHMGGYFSFKMNDESSVAVEAMYTSMSDIDRVIIGVHEKGTT
ncbi:unnamed protein product [Clonostachys rosea]|uniref:Heterokaryon incompatibility domain-containing protein n=1 Tax=Bionectria ochroleuca TaxID=29856 RepID=A0ABY6U496_BIOOC|nr:unnamed protein product [Clonostachys rosea]